MEDVSPLVAFGRKFWRRFVRTLAAAARSGAFRRSYAVLCVLILLSTTAFWTVLGARLQFHNADQLSDPSLFTSWSTFHGAIFPGSHTFLLKWPIFWLVGLFGVSSASLMGATLAVVLLTVGALAFLLYRIDRRPLIFGTVCLSLSLALLLVPAQPYAGGLLPVNMAMLTTRNLEYVVYLAALVLLARTRRLRSRGALAATLLLILLFASDKLFMSLSAGGALAALVVYALVGNWGLAAYAVRWLVVGVAAAVGASLTLFVVAATHLTHLTSSTVATPYGVISSGKNAVLGAAYAVLGLFTNAGANPAYDNRLLTRLPGEVVHRLWSYSGPAYLAAAIGLIYALILVWCFVRTGLRSAPRRQKAPVAHLLALTLIWSSVAAIGVFIVTQHYYPVDARYLTITLMALVVTVSVWLRRVRWQWPEDLLLIACFLVVAIGLAVPTALHASRQQTAALGGVTARNELVAAALKRHKVQVLVGDYWRVLPIRQVSGGSQTVMPLGDCTQAASALTSTAWRPNLRTHSFAYLASLQGNLTDFPACSLQRITKAYGLPNATQIIAGTPAKPKEVLLFYDQGSRPLRHTQQLQAPILPVSLNQLTDTACDQPTTMNVVAHEDDDLLFLSPDLLHDIQGGRCVRTVFLTAGDAGQDKFYWLSRQLGSEAAYSTMLGIKDVWQQQTVSLTSNEYLTIATPQGNPKVSLIFFNLPDGNLHGDGFADSGNQSLSQLRDGNISQIQTVDGQSVYNSDQLTTALSMLMDTYQPAVIHTQADVQSSSYPDHRDHVTTGLYAQDATAVYDQQHFGGSVAIPVIRYIGYPIHGYDMNVSGTDLLEKEAAFLAYAQYDGSVCRSMDQCARTPTYDAYLTRQYTQDTP